MLFAVNPAKAIGLNWLLLMIKANWWYALISCSMPEPDWLKRAFEVERFGVERFEEERFGEAG